MAKNKGLDFEIMVDVTEDEGLKAEGTVKGSKFIGTVTKKAVGLVCLEIGKALHKAMKDSEKVEEVTEAVEEVIEKEN